jgi:hypothetical protein
VSAQPSNWPTISMWRIFRGATLGAAGGLALAFVLEGAGVVDRYRVIQASMIVGAGGVIMPASIRAAIRTDRPRFLLTVTVGMGAVYALLLLKLVGALDWQWFWLGLLGAIGAGFMIELVAGTRSGRERG